MRLDEANALNINDLSNGYFIILETLTIKNKDKESPVNELWVWVLVVIYKEPASSYYWLNFKVLYFYHFRNKSLKSLKEHKILRID
jgi:hypothetical protein